MASGKKSKDSKSRRRPPLGLALIVLVLLVSLLLLQSSNVWKTLSVETTSDTLLLYALSSLNFVAFVIFALILGRSLLKLRQERKSFVLGSKLKTKLIIYFAGVSLLPLIAMAVFSYLFMNRALERWFSQIPEDVVREAGQLQEQSSEKQQENAAGTVRVIARFVNQNGADQKVLDLIRKEGNLAVVEILDSDNESVLESEAIIEDRDRNALGDLRSLLRQGKFADPTLKDNAGFDAVIADLDDDKKLVLIRSAGATKSVADLVESSLKDFDELKADQRLIRQIGLTTLGLLTFLLIFAASWAAFYVAKGLTKPIRALAEGADEIARGNYSHKVTVDAEDELELLVKAFNGMSERLEENANELQDERFYIETVLQSLSTGVISFDAEQRVRTINTAARGMLRLDSRDFSNVALVDLVGGGIDEVFEKLIGRASRIGIASEQTTFRHEENSEESPESSELAVALTASALPGNAGAVIVIEDLTELVNAQRAAAWQEVARRMAHEIKNPLTPIQLSAERIAKRFQLESDDGNGKEAQKKLIESGTETILGEVRSLKAMVDEFSKFARLPEPELVDLDVSEVLEQTVGMYQDRTDNLEIIYERDTYIPIIQGDAEQMKRVFVNLIENAIESIREADSQGQIGVTLTHDPKREIVTIEVADNGVGIDPRDIYRVFQPYFSTKDRETGLGLAIVQRIIRDHEGRISVRRNAKQGATFRIEIPTTSN